MKFKKPLHSCQSLKPLGTVLLPCKSAFPSSEKVNYLITIYVSILISSTSTMYCIERTIFAKKYEIKMKIKTN